MKPLKPFPKVKKFLLWTAAIVGILLIVYAVGPDVPDATLDATLPTVTQNLTELEADIERSEATITGLKKDNEARIIWADTSKQKTTYSIVYIHGFGASQAEGDPVHRDLAKRYGANLYLARLHDAGINDPNAFDDLTPENFVAGAKRALAIGEAIGDSVIVIGTSAGGLLTVYLAATHPEIKGIVLYSPCMAVANPALALATKPWGQQILNAAIGEHSTSDYGTSGRGKYWLTSYHSNGLMTLQQTIDAVARPEVYEKVKMPAFVGYYYKNDEEQDQVVSVAAIKDMFPKLGTPDALKVEQAFPNSGDHVIASHFTSKDVPGVERATEEFFEKILKIKPVATSL